MGNFLFLDCLASRDNNELRTRVYRKPIDAYRLNTVTPIKTLTSQAQPDCGTSDSLRDENIHLERVFHKNNYNADSIRQNIYRPTEAEATNRNPTPATILQ